MARIWQYPGLVEPVVTTVVPETIRVDKWNSRTNEPSRRRRTLAYITPTTVMDPVALTQPERVSADRGFRQVSDPTRRRRTNAWMPSLAQSDIFAKEVVSLDRWMPQRVDYVFRTKRQRHIYPSWFGLEEEPAEQPKLDWQPQPTLPRWSKPRRPHLIPSVMLQESIRTPATVPEMMAAIYQTPIPYLRHKPRQYIWPFSAFKEPSVLFHPCPPLTDWTPGTVAVTDWGQTNPGTTNWTQTALMDASDLYDFDDLTVDFDSLTVPFDGLDITLLEGSLADPPNTNWNSSDPGTTDWQGSSTPTTDWDQCGGSEG
jgi:hypothetical protein